MESQGIIQQLSAIPIGTIIAWTTVLASIIGVVSTGTIKLYKIFEKAHETKEENEEFKKLVKDHEEEIKSIKDILLEIKSKIDENDKLELKNLRHKIVRAAEEHEKNPRRLGLKVSFAQIDEMAARARSYREAHNGKNPFSI